MSTVGQKEIKTQQRALHLLTDELGYRYLGHWQDRDGNSNIEEELLTSWLQGRGHSEKIISRVLHAVNKAVAVSGVKTLYDANREVYGLLRYGVKVKPDVGEQSVTVYLVDWGNVEANDFAVAEEVTVLGNNTKRPDLVLYVNGIALGILELKRSTVSVSEGIRQNLDSQKKSFIEPFFSTIQLVMAGNDTEGLRYGVIATPEKYYLTWKEQHPGRETGSARDQRYLTPEECPGAKTRLESELMWLLRKERLAAQGSSVFCLALGPARSSGIGMGNATSVGVHVALTFYPGFRNDHR